MRGEKRVGGEEEIGKEGPRETNGKKGEIEG